MSRGSSTVKSLGAAIPQYCPVVLGKQPLETESWLSSSWALDGSSIYLLGISVSSPLKTEESISLRRWRESKLGTMPGTGLVSIRAGHT